MTKIKRKVFKLGATWPDYWNSLNEPEKQSLRDKARWEHMTLMAVAIEWGAIDAALSGGRKDGGE